QLHRPPPAPPLFPYTTLFRSRRRRESCIASRSAARPSPDAPERGATAAVAVTSLVAAALAKSAHFLAWNGGHRGCSGASHAPPRSEEHTSELQSLRHLVFRLL